MTDVYRYSQKLCLNAINNNTNDLKNGILITIAKKIL